MEIESALVKGDSILIFPEGTFGYAAGLRPFRMGAFKIALKLVCRLFRLRYVEHARCCVTAVY